MKSTSFDDEDESIDGDNNGDVSPTKSVRSAKSIKSFASVKSTQSVVTMTSQGVRINHQASTNSKTISGHESQHFYSLDETMAFSTYINDHLIGGGAKDSDPLLKSLPFDIQSEDIFTKVDDGFVLAKLVNLVTPNTIDERKLNKGKNGVLSVYQKQENLNLVLTGAKQVGCRIVNIGGLFILICVLLTAGLLLSSD